MRVQSDSSNLIEYKDGTPDQIPELLGVCIDGREDVEQLIDDLTNSVSLRYIN